MGLALSVSPEFCLCPRDEGRAFSLEDRTYDRSSGAPHHVTTDSLSRCEEPEVESDRREPLAEVCEQRQWRNGRFEAEVEALLGRLRDASVWLLDASPAALYGPGGTKPSSRTIDQAIDVGYELHVRHVIEAAPPSEIICVGKGVGDVLATRLRRTGATVTVVPQPNARVTNAKAALRLRGGCSAVASRPQPTGGDRLKRPFLV